MADKVNISNYVDGTRFQEEMEKMRKSFIETSLEVKSFCSEFSLLGETMREFRKGQENKGNSLNKKEGTDLLNTSNANSSTGKTDYDKHLAEFMEFMKKRKEISDSYNESISKASSDEEKKSITAEREQILGNLDKSMIANSELWTSLFANAGKLTGELVTGMLGETQRLLDYFNGMKDSKVSVGIDEKKLADMLKILEKLKNSLKDLGGEKDSSKENKVTGLIGGFKNLKAAGGDVEKQMDAVKQVIVGVQAASTVFKEIGGMMESLGSKSSEALNGTAEVLGKTASMASTGASIAGPWGAAAGAAVGLATSLTSVLAKAHDGKKEKEIKKLQKQIDALNDSYQKLGKAIEDAYSQDASKMIHQQNTMLEQQKVLIQNQIIEEQGKKKSDKSKIEAYQKQLDKIDETIANNNVKAQDAIFGADVKSAIDEFANAYAEAWTTGENKANSMKEVVKKMIKGVIIEMLKSQFAPTVQTIRNKIEAALADGIISDYEQGELDNLIEQATRDADKKNAWAGKYFEKEGDSSSSSKEPSKMGVASMSQDSADELNGRFTALQMIGEEIRGQFAIQMPCVTGMSVNMEEVKLYTRNLSMDLSIMKDIAFTSMEHLSAIEKNTKHLQYMREDLSNMKNKISNL